MRRIIMTIDERGNVVWTRESDDHRLYYVNNNGVWSDDYVSVSDRSILDDLTKTEAKVDGGAKVSSHTSKTGINDIFKVFKFASDKTKVEWAVHLNGDTYTIGTKHDSSNASSWKDNLLIIRDIFLSLLNRLFYKFVTSCDQRTD